MNEPRPGRALLVRVVACAVLGVVTTFAVSVATSVLLPCLKLRQEEHACMTILHSDRAHVFVHRVTGTGMERRMWFDMRDVLVCGNTIYGSCETRVATSTAPGCPLSSEHASWGILKDVCTGERDNGDYGIEDARGWPRLSFWCAFETQDGSPRRPVVAIAGGLPFSPLNNGISSSDFRCIPLRPIWRGVALNSLIYAGLWTAPVCIVPMARIGVRRRRGLCPRCAYDLRGDFASGCPECGWGKGGSEGGVGRA